MRFLIRDRDSIYFAELDLAIKSMVSFPQGCLTQFEAI